MQNIKILYFLITLLGHSYVYGVEISSEGFKEAALITTLGTKMYMVVKTLGIPDKVESKDSKDVKALNAEEGFVYRHPEWATIYLLIGIKNNEVTGLSVCTAHTWTTSCETPTDYYSSSSK